jgi:hypothetical protein
VSAHSLRVSAAVNVPRLTVQEFLWRPRPMSSSFEVNFGPRCEALGPLSELHADLVRLATLVFLVDRTAPRPRTWVRELELTVPVSDEELWSSNAVRLEDLLAFLSGDDWRLVFERRRMPRAEPSPELDSDAAVCLLSGGGDSLAGAVLFAEREGQPALVSHSDFNIVSGAQNRLITALRALWDQPLDYQRLRLGRIEHQLGTGDEFPKEGTSRSRSFLFIALGLAAAAGRGGRLIMPENGFASLNVPFSGERRGALSTRTTHPGFLRGLEAVLNAMGVSASIENPIATMTKGQVFAAVAGLLGNDDASKLLSTTYSCAKPVAFRRGLPPGTHCGLCYGCLVRRAAFAASGVRDRTNYIDQELTGARRNAYLTPTVLSTYNATRYAIAKGVSEVDIVALGLPDSLAISDATALARAGLAELAQVHIA